MYYDVERKKIKEAQHQIRRDFALKYSEIQKSELSESEKKVQINKLFEKSDKAINLLYLSSSLDEISVEDKENLGIKDPIMPTNIDTNVIDTLVSLFAKKAKISASNYAPTIAGKLTLKEDEKLDDIDTSAFEEELRQFFIDHYYDLLNVGYNDFLSDLTEEDGEILEMAIRHGLDEFRLDGFGYKLTVQDGLVSEENRSLGITIFYGTPDGINKRIFDLYSEVLFIDYPNKPGISIADDFRKIKNDYIAYAEENGITIENPDVLETLPVDMEKVQKIANHINEILNQNDKIKSGDYSQLISEDIIKNYSKIMNFDFYNFSQLESVKKIAGKNFIFELTMKIKDEDKQATNKQNSDVADEKSVKELDEKLTDLKATEEKTKALCEQYEELSKKSRNKSNQEQ